MNSSQATLLNPVQEGREPGSQKLAILPVTLEALEGALYLPEGYHFVAVHYDEQYRILKFLVTSEELPEAKELYPLPTVDLRVSVEFAPEDHRFRHITTRIQ